MPEPRKAETLSHFIGRYLKSPESRKSFPSQKQRAAVAYSEYKRKAK
jgi:hypothetical protein